MKYFWILASILFGILGCTQTASAITPVTTPSEHVRSVEQTLLTFPEWFLVFSPNEYGEFIAKQRPSEFPFYTHIGQFWQSYKGVIQAALERNLDSNPGYHLMIMVIGVSTTVEYAIKSAYETLIGKLTESAGGHDTQEDRYAINVAQNYVSFIRDYPWYEYSFAEKLYGLWSDTDFLGPNPLRKWERKFALTTEYGIKMVYGKLIKLGTQSIYETPLMSTAVVVDAIPEVAAQLPGISVLERTVSNGVLLLMPRYEGFTAYAQVLAKQGVNFQTIAGNQSFILVSVLSDQNWVPVPNSIVLFIQEVSTSPNTHRRALLLPVGQLAATLRYWDTTQVKVEHIFDY